MAIEGPLRELGIHDVFQLLDLNRKTGVLRLTSALRHNQGAVWFRQGAVVYAEIQSNPHPLGNLLVRAGKISEADLEGARRLQDERGDGRRIGDVLVEMGAIHAAELDRQIKFQIEEVIFEMMNWQEGYFSFTEESVDDVPGDALTHIRIESLLMEGARRIDEWSRMERKVPHVGVVPVLAPGGENEGGALDLLPSEWEVLALVDGERNLREIANALARSEFDVARTIFGMEAAGVVSLHDPGGGSETPATGAASLEDLLENARRRLADDDIVGARSIVEAALGAYPHEARLYVLSGDIYFREGQAASAEEHFRRALRLDSLMTAAHRRLGDALARQGKFGEATAWWTRWIKLSEQTGGNGDHGGRVEEAVQAARILETYLRGTDG